MGRNVLGISRWCFWGEKFFWQGDKFSQGNVRKYPDPMQEYKSLHVVVVICTTEVTTQTQTQTYRQTESQPDGF